MYPRYDQRPAEMRRLARGPDQSDPADRPDADAVAGRRAAIAIIVLLGLAALFGVAEVLAHR